MVTLRSRVRDDNEKVIPARPSGEIVFRQTGGHRMTELIHNANSPKTDRILRLPLVKDRTGLSRSSIYDKIPRGEFPRQIKLGPRAVGWRESDIETWIEERAALSEKEGR
jgi:prophage regulatory protein